ncbi:MAG: type II toxin-antitoxin system VapC family toxin [Actinobacteria bacterium]|nr:type II toxin-antitoxin system VapC family toxin [Actinomycetota bacterium]
MPTTGSGADAPLLVDTSVAIALVVEDHEHHRVATDAVGNRSLGLAGHAAFETFSVLTRLAPPARRTSATVLRLLEGNFPESRFLSDEDARGLFGGLATLGIAGGSVYDALVGAAARAHGLQLATRDRRAVETYRALEVDVLWTG